MKPVFKCDYCDFMNTEDKVKEHELICMDNYDRKSCYTCAHKHLKDLKGFKCDCGIEIPEGKLYEFCKSYERKEKSNYDLGNIFSDIFGGIK